MYLLNGLVAEVFGKPYDEGYRHLRILSGYASPAFLEYILVQYPELNIELTIGMVSHDGISIANHQTFQSIVERHKNEDTDRTVEVYYQIARPGNHTKIYHWNDGSSSDSVSGTILELPPKVYVGSANFSYNAFFTQKELLVESTHLNIDEVFEGLTTMSCLDPLIDKNINLYKLAPRVKTKIKSLQMVETQAEKPAFIFEEDSPYVELSLLTKDGKIPNRSGINWGQRKGRNRNQAYITVFKEIHDNNPTFFPEKKVPFVLHTDDGEKLICVMAQDNRKAIETMENNSIMGAYLRRRLGLPDGEFVTAEHLKNYGRTHVHIYKIDDETYYLDFSIG